MNIERRLQLNTRLPVILLSILLPLQIITPARAWSYLIVALLALLGLSFLWAREMRDRITLTRETRGTWVLVGDELEERFTLVNRSYLPALWVTVSDRSTLPGYHTDRVSAVDGQTNYSWKARATCQRRGIFTLGPTEVHLGDPFGLFRVMQRYPTAETILVYPRAMHLPSLKLARGQGSEGERHPERTQDETITALNVRPYMPGDSLRHIHWKLTAHQGSLHVRQFEREPTGSVWLVLDLDANMQAGEGEESTEEYGVILIASLTARYLGQNRSVGLVAYGKETVLIPPQRGEAQLWRILYSLATASPDPEWPLHRTLATVSTSIGRGRTVVVITPSNAADWVEHLLSLTRQGTDSAAILLDRTSFLHSAARSDEHLHERRTDAPPSEPLRQTNGKLTSRDGQDPYQPSRVVQMDDHTGNGSLSHLRSLLADQGFPSYVIQRGFPFTPLVRQKRVRTEFRVLGTGRVVQVEVEEEV